MRGEGESESAYGEDEGDKSERRVGVVLHFGWEINFLQKCFILTRGVIDLRARVRHWVHHVE